MFPFKQVKKGKAVLDFLWARSKGPYLLHRDLRVFGPESPPLLNAC